jgi:hypothetical protein
MARIPGSRGSLQVPGAGNIQNDIYSLQVKLDTVQKSSVFPLSGIINSYLSAADIAANFDSTGKGIKKTYIGWAICNGSNGTPNLASKFIRESVTASGATGGSDTQAAHTHAMPHDHDINHDHGVFNSGSESSHTHTGGSLCADIDFFTNAIKYKYASHNSTAMYKFNPTQSGSSDTSALTAGVVVDGTTDSGSSHLHTVDVPALGAYNTGASSNPNTGTLAATDNKPAYFELVPLMRIS